MSELQLSKDEIDKAGPVIKEKLEELGESTEEFLQYVQLLIGNGKTSEEFKETLVDLLDEKKAVEFTDWVWNELPKKMKNNTKAEPLPEETEPSKEQTSIFDHLDNQEELDEMEETLEEREGKDPKPTSATEKGQEDEQEAEGDDTENTETTNKRQRERRPESVIVTGTSSRRSTGKPRRWKGSDRDSASIGSQRASRLLGGALSAASRSTKLNRRSAMEREMEARGRERENNSRKRAISIRGGVNVRGLKEIRKTKKSITLKRPADRKPDTEQPSFKITFGADKPSPRKNGTIKRTSTIRRRVTTSKRDEVALAAAAARGIGNKAPVRFKKVLVKKIVRKRKVPQQVQTTSASSNEKPSSKRQTIEAPKENKTLQSDSKESDSKGTYSKETDTKAKVIVQKPTAGDAAGDDKNGEEEEVVVEIQDDTKSEVICWNGMRCFNLTCIYRHPAGWDPAKARGRGRGRGRGRSRGRFRGRGRSRGRGRGRGGRGRGRGNISVNYGAIRARGRGRSFIPRGRGRASALQA
mmetsp:Transcript_23586/g.35328  ORF Transcript_23586/g.35328 Transcript_23586/m.35328 type:complete len:526 (+) Transcript_23586:94-1671(+)